MPQSPEVTGSAGFTYEGKVGAFYLSCLLAEAYARGIKDARVSCVFFQQRAFGEPLDDVIVDFLSATGSCHPSIEVLSESVVIRIQQAAGEG